MTQPKLREWEGPHPARSGLAAAEDRYHGRIPKFPMLQERNVRTGFFDDAMFEAVRAKLSAPLQPVVSFAYVTGWRIQSEILPLEWRHIRVRHDPSPARRRTKRAGVPLHRHPARTHGRSVARA